MGTSNTVTARYMENRQIFADLCNFYIHGGEPVIRPEQLHSLDGTELTLNHKRKEVHKERDLLMSVSAMRDANTAYLIIGVENQTSVDYSMPVRNMLYDAMRYDKQIKNLKAETPKNSKEFLSGIVKEQKLLPLITLVVYFGTEAWDGPLSLHEMLHVEHPDILKYAADYKVQLVAPYHLSDAELQKFQSNLKQVLSFIKYEKDKKKIMELMQDDAFTSLDKDAAEVISTCTRLKLNLEEHEQEGAVNMCQAIEEIIQDRIEEERAGMCQAIEEIVQDRIAEERAGMHQTIEEIVQDRIAEERAGMHQAWEEIKEEYAEERANEERKTFAVKLLEDALYPLNKIAELTGLSEKEVEDLKLTIA